jgi:hypothetical protein
VIYFFKLGNKSRSCETRLNPDGPGFQLLVTENGDTRVEDYDALPAVLAREHELVQAWRAQGWQEVGSPTRASDDWSGPR